MDEQMIGWGTVLDALSSLMLTEVSYLSLMKGIPVLPLTLISPCSGRDTGLCWTTRPSASTGTPRLKRFVSLSVA